MADLLTLERWCLGLPDRIDKAVNVLVRETIQVMADDVIDHTPVDTTLAASNWQGSIRSPSGFELPAIYPGERGSTAPQSRSAAKAHVSRALADKDPGVTFYLSNLAPYIIDLNNGTSRQEPAGMVDRAVLVGLLHLQRGSLRL